MSYFPYRLEVLFPLNELLDSLYDFCKLNNHDYFDLEEFIEYRFEVMYSKDMVSLPSTIRLPFKGELQDLKKWAETQFEKIQKVIFDSVDGFYEYYRDHKES